MPDPRRIPPIVTHAFRLLSVWAHHPISTDTEATSVILALFKSLERYDPDRYWKAFGAGRPSTKGGRLHV
jgi:hypothetical protein